MMEREFKKVIKHERKIKTLNRFVLLLLLNIIFLPLICDAQPSTFSKSKGILKSNTSFFKETFYCSCSISMINGKLLPDLSSCGVTARKNLKRAQRIEWEHIVPAATFGSSLECWKQGGRKHCAKSNQTFKFMEADLHNLTPAIGEINGDRSNFEFGIIADESRAYGACDFEIDFSSRQAEPRPEIRGDIARIYSYMIEKYGVKIDAGYRSLLKSWQLADPVSAEECKLNKLKSKYQGWENRFISMECAAAENSIINSTSSDVRIQTNKNKNEPRIEAPISGGKTGIFQSSGIEGSKNF